MFAHNKSLWLCAGLCMAAILTCALCFPGARFGFLLPAAFICGGIIVAAYERCEFRTSLGSAVVMIGYTLVVCGIILNINYFTVKSGGLYYAPVLFNDDARNDWINAVCILDGRQPQITEEAFLNLRYLSYIAAGLMSVFGRDIGVPLMFNAICYSSAVILIGSIAWRISRSRRVATVAMFAATLMCYLMAQAAVLLKDVPLTMCVAALVLVMTKWSVAQERTVSVGDCLILAVAICGIGFFRANMLLMILLGVFIFAFSRRIPDLRFIGLAVFVMVVFILAKNFLVTTTIDDAVNVDRATGVFSNPTNARAWNDMIGDDYTQMPVWRRIVILPASVVVQFLIPFPWNFVRDTVFGPFQAVAHFGYFWYVAGAILIYWIFGESRRSPRTMQLLVLWGIMLTVITAYMTSGRVSRYCLPYLPMLLPAVAYAACRCYRRRSFRIWLAIFAALLVPALIICHHLQMSAA